MTVLMSLDWKLDLDLVIIGSNPEGSSSTSCHSDLVPGAEVFF